MSVARHPRPKELEGVPIEEIMKRFVGRYSEKRADWAAFELADAGEVVVHLFLLVPQLFFVRQHLPLATSAHAEMAAKRLYAVVGIGMEADGAALGPVFLVFAEADIYGVAGYGICNEDNLPLYAGQ